MTNKPSGLARLVEYLGQIKVMPYGSKSLLESIEAKARQLLAAEQSETHKTEMGLMEELKEFRKALLCHNDPGLLADELDRIVSTHSTKEEKV